MFSFLHNYNPSPVILKIGWVALYWYGLFIVLGILAGLGVILRIARLYQNYFEIKKERIYPVHNLSMASKLSETRQVMRGVLDLSFFLIIFGIIGARLFDVVYNLNYFLENPINIFKIWQGGMSIHGAIFAGIITLFFYCRRHKDLFLIKSDKNIFLFLFLADIIVPGLILGQAIGRWGNYFNQELYGLPTSLPFGILINSVNRVSGFENFLYFHPTFLYEFFLNLIIFAILIWLHLRRVNKLSKQSIRLDEIGKGNIFLSYLTLYSLSRFFIEFLRIDSQPIILGLRLGQWISLLLIIASLAILINKFPCFSSQKVKQWPTN